MSTIQDLITHAKEQGFAVYAPQDLSTYFYFSKDDKIGYCQFNEYRGASFATVHKANSTSGTGYAAKSFEEALGNRPHWASSGDPVVKYSSLEEFLRKHWQPLIAL